MKKMIVPIIIVITVILFWSYATPTTPKPDVTPVPVTTDINFTAEGTITTSSAPTSTVTVATKEFTIIGSNFSFTPNTLEVKQGDTVKIIFKNANGFHDFKINEFQVATKQIKSGESETVQFIADKTGSFEYYCSVGNHRAMGMKGTLTVK